MSIHYKREEIKNVIDNAKEGNMNANIAIAMLMYNRDIRGE